MWFHPENETFWASCQTAKRPTFHGTPFHQINYKRHCGQEKRPAIGITSSGHAPYSFILFVGGDPEYRAWSVGDMPCAVFADFLYERFGEQIPQAIYDLLREPCENPEPVGAIS